MAIIDYYNKQGKTRMDANNAETIAISALQHMAGNQEELSRFLSLTGMAVSDLREMANSTELYGAVLGYYLDHEPGLLTLATSMGLHPQDIVKAHAQLSGAGDILQSGEF